ncbi:MAG TPA: adenylate/guanylate cyclase domain-containing protein [Rhodocyclaceae bacterium]|nr:adenylate/guanylate cyclase domain-containing protein [Rhodocyclaceae bacterium]
MEMNAPAACDEEERRVRRALLAHLGQEFMAPVSSIVGYADILIEEARERSLDGYLPDLERIAAASAALQSLLRSVLARDPMEDDATFDRARLRHDLRTPINAIKGYGEMLAEDAESDGEDALRADLDKLLDAADGMLKRIDALVDFNGAVFSGTAQDAAISPGAIAAARTIRSVAAAPSRPAPKGRILIVDDNASNRDLLSRQLLRAGHTPVEADGGHAALARVSEETFDLVLLDLIMPEISGYDVLHQLKADPHTRDIPVLVMSALDELDSTIRCIEAGAVDFLSKPIDTTLLYARISASLENKQLRDREKDMLLEIQQEKARYEDLLLSILPRPIVDRINNGEQMIADEVEAVTILFVDIVNFTPMAGRQSATALVRFLNEIFSAFDELTQRFGGEKIKTIGDAYMVAFGLPDSRPDHVEAAALLAREILGTVGSNLRSPDDQPVTLRLGMHTGPAIAGIIGQRKFSFDVWGSTVNVASRMESHGEPGRIHVSENVAQALSGKFAFVERGLVEVKGAGAMRTFFLGDPL